MFSDLDNIEKAGVVAIGLFLIVATASIIKVVFLCPCPS